MALKWKPHHKRFVYEHHRSMGPACVCWFTLPTEPGTHGTSHGPSYHLCGRSRPTITRLPCWRVLRETVKKSMTWISALRGLWCAGRGSKTFIPINPSSRYLVNQFSLRQPDRYFERGIRTRTILPADIFNVLFRIGILEHTNTQSKEIRITKGRWENDSDGNRWSRKPGAVCSTRWFRWSKWIVGSNIWLCIVYKKQDGSPGYYRYGKHDFSWWRYVSCKSLMPRLRAHCRKATLFFPHFPAVMKI